MIVRNSSIVFKRMPLYANGMVNSRINERAISGQAVVIQYYRIECIKLRQSISGSTKSIDQVLRWNVKCTTAILRSTCKIVEACCHTQPSSNGSSIIYRKLNSEYRLRAVIMPIQEVIPKIRI